MTQRVARVFTEALDVPPDIDRSRLKFREYGTRRSPGPMTLVAALENEFDIMMEADDILEMCSFGKAVEIMRKYDT
ncbi:MAG: hypothetical protein P4M00_14530 [Azospirillaceae bacterium]|nr:hypothetical protein [Azospirillaceae bacterium]